jgi:hypothetical protein
LVAFSLAKQEKVTCCRATPGGFSFDVGLRDETANPTYTIEDAPQSIFKPPATRHSASSPALHQTNFAFTRDQPAVSALNPHVNKFIL